VVTQLRDPLERFLSAYEFAIEVEGFGWWGDTGAVCIGGLVGVREGVSWFQGWDGPGYTGTDESSICTLLLM